MTLTGQALAGIVLFFTIIGPFVTLWLYSSKRDPVSKLAILAGAANVLLFFMTTKSQLIGWYGIQSRPCSHAFFASANARQRALCELGKGLASARNTLDWPPTVFAPAYLFLAWAVLFFAAAWYIHHRTTR